MQWRGFCCFWGLVNLDGRGVIIWTIEFVFLFWIEVWLVMQVNAGSVKNRLVAMALLQVATIDFVVVVLRRISRSSWKCKMKTPILHWKWNRPYRLLNVRSRGLISLNAFHFIFLSALIGHGIFFSPSINCAIDFSMLLITSLFRFMLDVRRSFGDSIW